MKKPAITMALVSLAACAMPAVAQQPVTSAKPAVQPATKVPLTGEQKLAKLTPAERAEFEKHAKTLGLDAKKLAAKDQEAARKDMEAAKAKAGSAQDAMQRQQDAMQRQQEAIQRISDIMKKMHETQRDVIRNMK